jgi:hypothetical protein
VVAGEGVQGPAVRSLLVQAPVAALYAALVGTGLLVLNQRIREGES